MSMIVSIHSFRGGTGKSNLTANLAAAVARGGNRVGVVDTDIQSPGIHVLFGLGDHPPSRTLNDYLWGRCSIKEAACDVSSTALIGADDPRSRLFLIPSSLNAGEIARVLREGYDVSLLNDGFHSVTRDLELDFLFIDTHPGVNEETLLSIALSDVLLLILAPDQQDFQGTAVTVELARRLEVSSLLLVLNKVPPGMEGDQLATKVGQLYKSPVSAQFPLYNEVAQLGSSGLFALKFPDHPFSKEIHRLAARLIATPRAA